MEPDPVLERQVTDLSRGHAEQYEGPAGVITYRGPPRRGEQDELVRLRRPDSHRLLRVGRDELGRRAVRDKPAAADDDQVVGGVLHLRHEMAGDEDRASLR